MLSTQNTKLPTSEEIKTVKGFGNEWQTYNQSDLSQQERQKLFHRYFSIFPWSQINSQSIGADFGCGSGRWAQEVAPRVGRLNCVDASHDALNVTRQNLARNTNCNFIHAPVHDLPLAENSLDFGYS